jgi:hypothetical protein
MQYDSILMRREIQYFRVKGCWQHKRMRGTTEMCSNAKYADI